MSTTARKFSWLFELIYWSAVIAGLYVLYILYGGKVHFHIYGAIGPFSYALYLALGIMGYIGLVWFKSAIETTTVATATAITTGRPIRYEGKHFEGSLYRTARKLEKRKDYTGAGEAYESLESWIDAARCFEKAGLLSRAGAALEKAGEPLMAIELYEREENYEMAASKSTAEGLRERALKNYKAAAEKAHEENSFLRAANFYERAYEFERAARIFETLKRTEDALRCYERGGITGKLEQMLADLPAPEIGRNSPVGIEVVRRSVEHLVKQRKFVQAAEALEKVGDGVRAAEIYETAELYEKAGEAYLQAGLAERAKAVYSKVPDDIKVADFLARLAIQEGDWQSAGAHFENAQKPNQAVEAYKRAKEYIAAAKVYDSMNRHLMAGEMYSSAKEFQRAGESFAKGHDWRNAAECFMQIGDTRQAIAAFVSAGNNYRAGMLAIQLEDYAAAAEYLQRVSPTAPEVKTANGFLAVAFSKLDRKDMARELFRRVIDQITPSTETLPILYEYGNMLEAEEPARAIAVYQRILGVDVNFRDVAARIPQVQDSAVLKPIEQPGRRQTAIPTETLATMGDATVNTKVATETMERPGKTATHSAETRFGDEGRYRILHEVGRGGMAVVYKAIDQLLEREVALKTFPLSRNAGPGREEVFLNEARLIARLSHPNIVTIFDSGHMNFLYYIAMEFVAGENLKQLIKRKGPLSMEEIRSVFRQLADALIYAHSQQVLHRDIKPGNIIMRENGNLKMVDFGLAKILKDAATEAAVNEDSQRTLVGTPQYMAPEQILGTAIDARTDIYALGLTMFYAMTGRTPFDVRKITDPLEISRMQLHSSFPRPSTLRATLPPALDEIFVKCTQKNPPDRYQTVAEFLEDLVKV